MAITRLFYRDEEYLEENKLDLGGEKGALVLDDQKKSATLYFEPKASIVDKRMAERYAQSICKIGYVLENGIRIGVGYKLEVMSKR
jgi:hypothetical protein